MAIPQKSDNFERRLNAETLHLNEALRRWRHAYAAYQVSRKKKKAPKPKPRSLSSTPLETSGG